MTELRTLISELAHQRIGAGLIGIVISDKDGVPVLKVAGDANTPTMEGCFRHQFLSVCSTLQEHALKMCLGPTASITATFDDYQVIHCYHSSLILTIIASNEALTGQLMNLSNSLKPLITDMAKHVLPAVA